MSDLKLGSEFGAPKQEDWLQAVEQALRGKPADTLVSHDLAGFTRQPLYTEANNPTATDNAGWPGFAPFTRGARPVNNKFLPWHIAQRAVIGRKGVDNAAIMADLRHGVSAIALDMSEKTASANMLDKLLDGVMLDIAPLSLTPSQQPMQSVQAIVKLYAKRQTASNAVGYLNLDPPAARLMYGAQATLDYDALAQLANQRPALRLMTSSGAAYHALGAGVGQELGWMLAGLTASLRAFEKTDLKVAEALGKITLTVAADVDFFATMAKVRAARLLFANISNALGTSDVVPQIHAETSLRAFCDIDPWVNILRATTAAMGAGIAGVDMMTVAPCTAASASDNRLTRRIARNTQLILQEESHIGHVADAAGGSWYVEQLTRQLAEAGWVEFQKVEAAGGLYEAIESGMIGDALDAARTAFETAIDKRSQPLVGVSEFPNLEEAPLEAGSTKPYRLAAGFEKLRHAAQKAKPKVFLACLGHMTSFTSRANFAANIYAAGGLYAVSGDGGTDYLAIGEAFKKSTAKVAVICGSDTDYEAHASGLAAALKSAGATHLALAGRPQDLAGRPQDLAGRPQDLAGKPQDNADIDAYCYAGCAALSFLRDIHRVLGLEA